LIATHIGAVASADFSFCALPTVQGAFTAVSDLAAVLSLIAACGGDTTTYVLFAASTTSIRAITVAAFQHTFAVVGDLATVLALGFTRRRHTGFVAAHIWTTATAEFTFRTLPTRQLSTATVGNLTAILALCLTGRGHARTASTHIGLFNAANFGILTRAARDGHRVATVIEVGHFTAVFPQSIAKSLIRFGGTHDARVLVAHHNIPTSTKGDDNAEKTNNPDRVQST